MTTTPEKDTPSTSDRLIQDQTEALRAAAAALVETRAATDRMTETLVEIKELVRQDRPTPRRRRWFR